MSSGGLGCVAVCPCSWQQEQPGGTRASARHARVHVHGEPAACTHLRPECRRQGEIPVIGPRFFLRVWCRGAAAPTPEQTSDTAGDGFSKIQQAGVRSALAPRMALAQGRTGSRGAHSATRRHATWSQTMRARSQHGSRRLGRRSFPIMFFRRALKHLLSMTNGYDDTPRSEPPGRPRAPALLRGDAGRLCSVWPPQRRSKSSMWLRDVFDPKG